MNKIKLFFTIILVLLEVPLGFIKAKVMKYPKQLLLTIGLISLFSLAIYSLHVHLIGDSNTGEDKAVLIEANNNPTLLCTATYPVAGSEGRTYEEGTYTIGQSLEYGWQVWWTDKNKDDTTAFHLNKCEIK